MVKQKLSKGCYSNKKGGSMVSSGTEINDKALNPTFMNYSKILSFISPYILISFFLLLSIFNVNAKGAMYFIGSMMLILIVSVFAKLALNNENIKKCNIFGDFLNDIPCYSTSLYSYTFTYLFLAMLNSNIMNFGVIVTILLIGAADSVARIQLKCTDLFGIFVGLVIGAAFGMIWYIFISTTGPGLLYFEEYVSNKVACSVPKKQDFKCQLYKDGELLDTIDIS
jgi:hypothetical protein